MKKNKYQRHSLKFLTNNVRKGSKRVLKYIKILDAEGEIKCVLNRRNDIEQVLIAKNTNHQKKVLETLAHKDIICNNLLKENIRDRIFEGTIERNGCENSDIYNFLTLLKRTYQN